jgi:hypothetical protein
MEFAVLDILLPEGRTEWALIQMASVLASFVGVGLGSQSQ